MTVPAMIAFDFAFPVREYRVALAWPNRDRPNYLPPVAWHLGYDRNDGSDIQATRRPDGAWSVESPPGRILIAPRLHPLLVTLCRERGRRHDEFRSRPVFRATVDDFPPFEIVFLDETVPGVPIWEGVENRGTFGTGEPGSLIVRWTKQFLEAYARSPVWRQARPRQLAADLLNGRAFDGVPALADALEGEGYGESLAEKMYLNACRQGRWWTAEVAALALLTPELNGPVPASVPASAPP